MFLLDVRVCNQAVQLGRLSVFFPVAGQEEVGEVQEEGAKFLTLIVLFPRGQCKYSRYSVAGHDSRLKVTVW